VLDTIRDVLRDDVAGKDLYVSPRPLAAGSTVETWTGDVHTTSDQEWMVFVDDLPQANWGHPARYVFEDIVTGVRTIVEAILPPLEFQLLLTIDLVTDPVTGGYDVGFVQPGERRRPPTGEVVSLACDSAPVDLTAEFLDGRQVVSYDVTADPGGTLFVSVADGGQLGDYWVADLYEGDVLVGTTSGGGDVGAYSPPATVGVATGRATVVVRYLGGIDAWPAHMGVRMWCAESARREVDLLCGEEYLEEWTEFQGSSQVLLYDVTVDPSSTLRAWVADAGTPGDIRRDDILSDGTLVATTAGDGSVDVYSQPAVAPVPSGTATVRVTYQRGIEIWPAHVWVRIECSEGVAGPTGPIEPVGPTVEPRGRKVAVLISGGGNKGSNHDRYWNDMSFMFRTLKERYGYRDEDIHVVYSDGRDTAVDQKKVSGEYADSPRDFDGDGIDDVDRASTRQEVVSLFDELRGQLTENDQLFVFATNHGSQQPEGTSHAVLVLFYSEVITDSDFGELAGRLDLGTGAFFFEQCFSGGMIDELKRSNHVVMSAADWDEYSWSCDTEGAYDELAYHFVSALMGKTLTGQVVEADGNGDGVVSMREAFNYARQRDSQEDEHPQYYEGTSGLGTDTSL
jgi:hypothetical protein